MLYMLEFVWRSCLRLVFMLLMLEFVLNFSMLSTIKDSNENRNSLARGSILNFLNSSLQDTLLLTPAIILRIFFLMIGLRIDYLG
jgi:hypothetical protein